MVEVVLVPLLLLLLLLPASLTACVPLPCPTALLLGLSTRGKTACVGACTAVTSAGAAGVVVGIGPAGAGGAAGTISHTRASRGSNTLCIVSRSTFCAFIPSLRKPTSLACSPRHASYSPHRRYRSCEEVRSPRGARSPNHPARSPSGVSMRTFRPPMVVDLKQSRMSQIASSAVPEGT
jgi:hypothetical protein